MKYSKANCSIHILFFFIFFTEIVLKAFKKESLHDKFNYEQIYVSLNDAVKSILPRDPNTGDQLIIYNKNVSSSLEETNIINDSSLSENDEIDYDYDKLSKNTRF